MISRFSLPNRTKGDLRFTFVILLGWLPAFGWMPDGSITFEVMKISTIIVVLLTLYAWLIRIETESSRAWVYVAIWVTPMFLTSLIYFIRYVELLIYTFSFPAINVTFWALIVFLISMQQMAVAYRKEREKLTVLREKGLLRKYKIFNENETLWKITAYYPGIDGSTPEQEARKDQQRWGCLSLLPISGITFYLIRTTQGSVAWILLFLFLFMYDFWLWIGIKTVVTLFQLRQWENELGESIYTDIAEK